MAVFVCFRRDRVTWSPSPSVLAEGSMQPSRLSSRVPSSSLHHLSCQGRIASVGHATCERRLHIFTRRCGCIGGTERRGPLRNHAVGRCPAPRAASCGVPWSVAAQHPACTVCHRLRTARCGSTAGRPPSPRNRVRSSVASVCAVYLQPPSYLPLPHQAIFLLRAPAGTSHHRCPSAITSWTLSRVRHEQCRVHRSVVVAWARRCFLARHRGPFLVGAARTS